MKIFKKKYWKIGNKYWKSQLKIREFCQSGKVGTIVIAHNPHSDVRLSKVN